MLVRPTAPGCLFLWGTLLCVGGRPPSLSFFAISSVRSSRPRPSRTATALLLSQTTTKHGPGKRGRASRPTLPSANRSAAFALRSIPSFFQFVVLTLRAAITKLFSYGCSLPSLHLKFDFFFCKETPNINTHFATVNIQNVYPKNISFSFTY